MTFVIVYRGRSTPSTGSIIRYVFLVRLLCYIQYILLPILTQLMCIRSVPSANTISTTNTIRYPQQIVRLRAKCDNLHTQPSSVLFHPQQILYDIHNKLYDLTLSATTYTHNRAACCFTKRKSQTIN
jgi:hypothetical protein